jgi:hypothetical protein
VRGGRRQDRDEDGRCSRPDHCTDRTTIGIPPR